jgi:uncharacterized protein YlbG (UPF0298 family)
MVERRINQVHKVLNKVDVSYKNKKCKFIILYKNTNHQQMHKESFIINCSTILHVSTLLGHLH